MIASNSQRFYKYACSLAVASGLLVVMLTGLVAYNAARGKVATLLNSRQVIRLHEELRSQPKNEALKTRIRQLDYQLRQEIFYRLKLSHNASRSLLVAMAVFLASAHFVRNFRRATPNPLAWGTRNNAQEKQKTLIARYSVGGMFALFIVTAVTVASQPVNLPDKTPAQPEASNVPPFPTTEEIQQQWPSFRGPNGFGTAQKATLPTEWNVGTGKNILWKTGIPLRGVSSPVVWDKAVFLTGADETQSSVYRIDLENGAILWTATVKLPGGTRPQKPQVLDDTSLAAPTPVTDGRKVYAVFPTGEIAAFDFNGKQIWARNIGPLENAYGYASSLAIYQDRLLIQIDRGQPEDGQSKLLALNTQTGQPLWEVKRPVAGSWSSPVLINFKGEPQLITTANPFVIAYNPVDGKELWRNQCLESDVAPSPILAGEMIVAIAPNSRIVGLHPDAKEIAWKCEDGVPDASSPVSDGKRIYVLAGTQLSCLNLETGAVLWTQDLGADFYASPTIAGNALILTSRKGGSWILEPGDSYKELGKGDLGEECFSMVPIGKRLLVRGKNNLFCIEGK